MKIVKLLNDSGVLISKKLADTIAAFKFHNCGSIDELASDFVKKLVKFTKEALQDSENFYQDDDYPRKIYNLISEDAASRELQDAIDKIEDDLHEWKVGDELDNLIVEIIACTVESTTHSSDLKQPHLCQSLPNTEENSVLLTVEGSQEYIEQLVSSIKSEDLKKLSDFPILDVQILSKNSEKSEDEIKKPPTLEQLMEGVTAENMHSETDWGSPVGKEIW
jgi:hypothetical protein